MRVLTDTNILLRLNEADSPAHQPCLRALQNLTERAHEPCVCAQVFVEFWVVATRPRDVNGLGLALADVEASLHEFERAMILLPEPPDMATRWRAIVSRYAVRGRQAHDARLVALMPAHGVTHLFTLNTADFARYTEITCISPNEVEEIVHG